MILSAFNGLCNFGFSGVFGHRRRQSFLENIIFIGLIFHLIVAWFTAY